MNLQTLLSSMTNVLLFVGLVILFINIIFSAVRLSRGHGRIGIINAVLVLIACGLITVGLLRMTFPALAGADSTTAGAAVPVAVNAGGVPAASGNTASSGSASGQRPAADRNVAAGTQSAAPVSQNSAGGFAPQGGAPAGQDSAGGFAPPNGAPAQDNGGFIPPNGAPAGQDSAGGFAPPNGAPAGQGGQSGQRGQRGQAGQTGQAAPGGSTATGTVAATAATNSIPASKLATLTIIGAIVILLSGLILYFGERREQGFKPRVSAGLFYAGAGIFVLVAALAIPGLGGQFNKANASGIGAASLPTSSAPAPVRVVQQQTALPTTTPVPSTIPTDLPTLTPVPSTSPTPLFTAVAYAASTDVSTATACSVTATTALNLRGDPSTQQQGVGKVFAGSLLSVTGQTADKKWWRVISNDGGNPVEGWVSADFVNPMPGCADDPVPVIGPTLVPTRIPRPSVTPSSSTAGNPSASITQNAPAQSSTVQSNAAQSSVSVCVVITSTSVSLRADPSTQHAAIGQIPQNTALNATKRSANGSWWYVTFTSGSATQEGWVGAGAVIAASTCSALPTA